MVSFEVNTLKIASQDFDYRRDRAVKHVLSRQDRTFGLREKHEEWR
jgi:hypothetical protein